MSKDLSSSSSITRQLQVVFAVSILILLISSYASYYSNRKLIESSEAVNHTNEVIVNAENLISIVKDAETGQRGYVITHDATFLQPYNGAYEKAIETYKHLKALTNDNSTQQKNLERAKVVIDQRFIQLRRVLTIAGDVPLSETGNVFASSHEEMTKGKLIMDDLRKVVTEIKNDESRLLQIRMSKQGTYIKYTPALVITAALISLLISVLAYSRIKADLDERVAKQKEDEALYERTSQRISVMEDVTRKIAQGDLSVRSADTEKDDLGRISTALNDMANNLERYFADLEQHNWLQTGALQLGNSIRGERYLKNVAGRILNSLAAYLDASVGTLYILNKNMGMTLQGGFALDDAPRELNEGQGLIGQAVKNKEMIVTSELPADYLKITSSTGSTKPAYLVILPLVFNNEVIGVIELGKLRKPQEKEIEFLKNNVDTIAVGINTAISYERIQDLLEETQAQTEELQAQHNELENINTALEAQTEKLQASEEELKVQQEELQQANQELEERSRLLEEKNQEILEKNFDVQRKAEELEQSTKYKSEFLANMSHELRTPLNSILLLSRLLSENTESNLNSDQVEYAKVILSSGNGLLLLIDEILDLSKIEAGKMLLEYETMPVAEIVEDMRGLFAQMAREKGVELKIGNDVTGNMETDKMRLEQVLKNLLSNALKFTKQGSVSLEVTKASDTFVSFSVKDTGIGIAPDKQKQIFEAFQQADGSTRRKYGGTGLGLSISKELVKLLGGTLEVDSAEGKGSCFTVTIPVAKQFVKIEDESDTVVINSDKEAVSADHKVEETRRDEYISGVIPENIPDDRAGIGPSDKSILIVEDDINFAKSLLEFTRKKGYKGIVAVRGDEGVELARRYKPAGILLDIQLPVKSGWEVMDELKRDATLRYIPVHMMSAMHQSKNELLMKGAIDFINKPIAFEQMQEIFAKIEHVRTKEKKKVLIVEENTKHANALAYFLSTYNINSEIKTSLNDTVVALQSEVDCVILDMQVPGQNAYDTLEEVKKTKELEGLPVIVFTGKSLSMTEEQRIKYYADSIVVKTAHSYQRVLDEVSLFLHLVEESKVKPANGNGFKKLGALKDVLSDKSVLVVDDDVRNIFSLTKALEKYGMNIITAIDGKEAMAKLQEHKKIDIVLLDMMMPEMDGYETARAIRKRREWKHLPVIAVTAKAMMGDREKCISAGASDYITKPVDIDQLLSLLRVWLYDKV